LPIPVPITPTVVTTAIDWKRQHSHDFHVSHWGSAAKNCSQILHSNWLGTIKSPLPVLCSLDYPNYFKSSNINTKSFTPLSFQYPWNSLGHPDDGGSTFL
jgi:hypothetical protein